MRRFRAVGAISGTSMDGIDVALLETDGHTLAQPGPGNTYPYPPSLSEALRKLVSDPDAAGHDSLTELEREVTDAHADAIARFIDQLQLPRASIDIVGLHGQTVYHRPERGLTRQLGLIQRAADALGIDVVGGFRLADVAAGGQGAPLAPLYHQALVASRGLALPLAVLNLGGVGNISYIDSGSVIAFDTGPGSALLDDFVRQRRGLAFDRDGRLAAGGKVDQTCLARLLAHPYFARRPPKSLDRNDFHRHAQALIAPLSDSDGAATLTAFTAHSVRLALTHLGAPPRRWLVAGGGRLNAAIMQGLQAALGAEDVAVQAIETLDVDGDFIEAQCFAYLAVRSLLGLPLSLPTTTGVPAPQSGGRVAKARRASR